MELVSQRLDEELLDVLLVDRDLLLIEKRFKMEVHRILVFLCVVQAGDLTRVQDIVDVLQEALIHDLSVVQNERRRHLFTAGHEHLLLQLLTEFRRVKVLSQLNLE